MRLTTDSRLAEIQKKEADLRVQKDKVVQKWDELVLATQKHDEKLKLIEIL